MSRLCPIANGDNTVLTGKWLPVCEYTITIPFTRTAQVVILPIFFHSGNDYSSWRQVGYVNCKTYTIYFFETNLTHFCSYNIYSWQKLFIFTRRTPVMAAACNTWKAYLSEIKIHNSSGARCVSYACKVKSLIISGNLVGFTIHCGAILYGCIMWQWAKERATKKYTNVYGIIDLRTEYSAPTTIYDV